MTKCNYKYKHCLLLAIVNIFNSSQSWCISRCWPNHQPAQLAMLRKFVDVPGPPEDKDLLEWVKEKVKDGTIKKDSKKIKPSGGCKGCGKFKSIARGFGRLICDEILGKEPEDWVVKRAEQCAVCEFRTFLNVIEWSTSAMFDNELPINHTPSRLDALWCAKCKCCIEAKIRTKDEECPVGKWPALA